MKTTSQMPEHLNRQSISFRLLFLVVLCSSLFTLIASIYQIYFYYQDDVNSIDDNMVFVQSSYLLPISGSLYTLDFGQLDLLLQSVIQFQDLEYVELLEFRGGKEIIRSVGDPNTSRDIVRKFPLVYFIPGSSEAHQVGTLIVVASFEKIYKRTWERAFMVLITNAVKMFLASFFILMIFQSVITRHLVNLAKFTQQLKLKKQYTPFALDRNSGSLSKSDEFDQVVWALNNMQKKISMDIDKRERVEEQLRRSEKKYHSLFASVNEGVCLHSIVYDHQGQAIDYKILETNPAFEMILGIKPEEVVNRLATQVYGTDKPPYLDIYLKVAETGEPVTFETFFPPMEKYLKISVFSPSKGQFATLFADITARKQTERELNLSNRRYQTLFQNSPVPLWEEDLTEVYQYLNKLRGQGVRDFRIYSETDPSFLKKCIQKVKILDVNQEALKLHGANTQKQLLGNLDKIFTNTSYETFKEEIIALSKGAFDFESEGVVKTLSGEKKSIFLKMIISREHNDSIKALIATIDITDRYQMEERLRQAQKMESIGTLAGGIAHDFNNLLFPILGMSEMLLEDLHEDSLEYENANEIFKAGKRASDLVKQILAFSRQSEHKMSTVRIQNILKEVLKLSRSTIPSNIEIQQNIQQNCGLVMADSTQIHQVTMNLITNAFHSIEDKNGVIDIELKELSLKKNDLTGSELQPGPYIRLSVSDNGIGMSQGTINKIFEPYFTTKGQGKGTGLGLAVVYGIIKEHAGEIKVYSEVGKGTTFNVYLPLMKKSYEIEAGYQSAEMPTGTESILLVDDDISVAKLEGKMLSRLGYKVTVKSSSNDALNTFKANPDSFDLVISDMTMPGMTGDQLTKKILSIQPETLIVICTGFSERINKEQAEVLGVKGFIMKPVTKSDMAQMVRNVLDVKNRGLE